jgi:KDO2-lipid IV(A) lauroyltransferase
MIRRTLRAGPELWLARLALRVVPRLSRPALCWIARALGAAAYRFGGARTRRVAEANLALVFPERSEAERRRILKRSIRSFALSMLDVFWLARGAERKIDSLVELDPSYERLFRPGPMICVTAHMGNWEALGMAISHRAGEPLASVAATIKNKRVNDLFVNLRRVTGQEVVPRKGAVRALLKTLRAGRKIALVMDQNTKPVEGGIFVDFLGRPAPVSTAPALLALRTGAPIVIGVALPTPDGRYKTLPLIDVPVPQPDGDAEAAVRAITARIADELSALIRAHPEAWVWSYKRWKIRPPAARAEDYPFYARPLHATDLPRGVSPDAFGA